MTEYDDSQIALAHFLDCDEDSLDLLDYDYHGLDVYKYRLQEYAIGTDSECDSAALHYIEESIWAFNAEFICDQCDLPFELAEAIQSFQESKCEDANDALLSLARRSPNGLKGFVQSAISADGRGHILSRCDGEEFTVKTTSETYYIYRIN